jgi:hypothetical protein
MSGPDAKVAVIALAEPPLPARLRILGRALRVVTFGRVAAVTAAASGSTRPTIDDVRQQHDIVQELTARTPAVLPARYGAVTSVDALQALVTAREASILEAFDLVRGRVQMTLRLFGPPDAERPTVERSSGTAFLKSRRERARHEPRELPVLREALQQWIAAERVEAGDGPLRATIFHLVPRVSAGDYRQCAERLAPAVAPHELRVSGPWAPFAFVPELV